MNIKIELEVKFSKQAQDFLTTLLSGWDKLSDKEKIETYPNIENPTVQQSAEVIDAVNEKRLETNESYDQRDLKKLAMEVAKKYDSEFVHKFLQDNQFSRISDVPEDRITEIYLKLKEVHEQ